MILMDTKNKRNSDIVCRYGGEEFVILLPNTSIEGAQTVAQKIRKNVESSIMNLASNKSLKYTISLGVSQVDVDNEINIEQALKRADDALYEAKEGGRNRVMIKL